MNTIKLVGAALIVAGVLALVYGGFSYTRERHDIKLGPVELAVEERERINVPVWAGVGLVAAGGLILLFGGRRK